MIEAKEQALNHIAYKAPTDETRPKHELVQAAFELLMGTIWDEIPRGPGKSRAFFKLCEARMEFNAAIANNGQ